MTVTAAALRQRVHGQVMVASLRERVHAPLTAAALRQRVHGLTAAVYDEVLHPRGKDGKWIEKLGIVLLSGVMNNQHYNNQRAKVVDIKPDPHDRKHPNVLVSMLDPESDKELGVRVIVKPDNISKAPSRKARLEDRSRAELEAQIPTSAVSPDDAALIAELRRRVHESNIQEAVRRWAEAEVTVINPNPEAVAAAEQEDLDALRARVHARARARQQQFAVAAAG